ncbi:hypothetical protein EK21DRAFT_71736, partial [Setomelanomma holmii]
DISSRLGVKRGGRLLSKTTNPAPSTISSPPRAAVAATSSRKDEVPRRRTAFNDMLRRRSGDETTGRRDPSTSPQNVTSPPGNHGQLNDGARGLDLRMVDRVADLERALVFAKEEQESLREELARLRESQGSDRVAIDTDPQQRSQQGDDEQNSDVEEGSEGPPERRHSLKELVTLDEGTSLERPAQMIQQIHGLQIQVAQLQDQLVAQEFNYGNSLEHASSHSNAEWNDLRSRLHATEKESQERLQQLFSLKSSISSLTRSDTQATDRELAEAFTQLANRIREWALVANALMHVLGEPVILGLPTVGPLAAIKLFAETIQRTGAEYSDWKRATVRAIEKSDKEGALQQSRGSVLQQVANEITHLLFTLTNVSLAPNGQLALMGIMSAAADLQRTLALQKARYEVLFFHDTDGVNTTFDQHRMDPINDLDEDVDDDTKMASSNQFMFCVFPCLQKFGDERGENLEVSNVLLKARVCCGVG